MSDLPKTTDKRARTPLACSIAATHPDRFNEAFASGFYPCAPKTRPGRARSFDVNDVIALWIYQRFLDEGNSPRRAGMRACEVRSFLEDHPTTDQMFILKPSLGSHLYLPDFDVKKQHMPEMGPAPDVVSIEIWNFGYLRQRIVYQIEEAAKDVG